MDYSEFYRVENLRTSQTELLNKLLEKGWKLIAVPQFSSLHSPGYVESAAEILVGASKEVFEACSLADAQDEIDKDKGYLF